MKLSTFTLSLASLNDMFVLSLSEFQTAVTADVWSWLIQVNKDFWMTLVTTLVTITNSNITMLNVSNRLLVDQLHSRIWSRLQVKIFLQEFWMINSIFSKHLRRTPWRNTIWSCLIEFIGISDGTVSGLDLDFGGVTTHRGESSGSNTQYVVGGHCTVIVYDILTFDNNSKNEDY